ncbi:transmembrane protein 254-like [Babylonia areolata]|uniref:transmembrane protein 254-like n=1 Tax=Babylonia areolata TaxID=304850 RepID=UPI003FCF0A7A
MSDVSGDMAGGGRRRQGGKPAMPLASFADNYFVFPHPFWMVTIPFGFCMLFIATFSPDSALHYLPWPLSDFIHYMGRRHQTFCISTCLFAVMVHCLEAAYTGKVCQDKRLSPAATAKWSFMTFIFGFASLIRLLGYKRPKSGDKQH